jgi:hypothetical protein
MTADKQSNENSVIGQRAEQGGEAGEDLSDADVGL